MNWDPESANPVTGSHLPWFEWACSVTDGAVLELGGGYYSTPLVASLSKAGRRVCTYEYDPEWAAELRQRFDHLIVGDFPDIPERSWDVVLIDCEGWNRYPFLDDLRASARIFVIHDSQDHWIGASVLNSFEYRVDREKDPRTTLVSDTFDLKGCP